MNDGGGGKKIGRVPRKGNDANIPGGVVIPQHGRADAAFMMDNLGKTIGDTVAVEAKDEKNSGEQELNREKRQRRF